MKEKMRWEKMRNVSVEKKFNANYQGGKIRGATRVYLILYM
eukprot:TRINITY_DN3796_c0_g1_i1.p4 TRINITY_DN3796_c0_g1~~TRINITY_DN3796_c0_g1_i1.p4  ORF type:complete len:51 (+),score=6.39 TRINITY_DN3796_c0_g1_i1:32-154(+)